MVLALVAGALAETVRASRLAMGTVVGVTVVAEPAEAERAVDAAYAAIDAGEAELSEWRPTSRTSRIGAGEVVALDGPAEALFGFLLALRERSGGAFDAMWRTHGTLARTPAGWTATGPLDLGGVLKGWLVDRAGEALLAAGVDDFLVDAAGDVLAHGDAEGGRGWGVEVWGAAGPVARVRLHDQALSTSGNAGQPGHVKDARTGAAVTGDRVVSVVAPSGMVADGLATAVFAGAEPALASRWGAVAVVIEGEERRGSRGARRVFRRVSAIERRDPPSPVVESTP
ncbi:MAG: FAD:protein FMN transferase [Myxococcota bacterium]